MQSKCTYIYIIIVRVYVWLSCVGPSEPAEHGRRQSFSAGGGAKGQAWGADVKGA